MLLLLLLSLFLLLYQCPLHDSSARKSPISFVRQWGRRGWHFAQGQRASICCMAKVFASQNKEHATNHKLKIS